jgi:hypothetical protein
MTLRNVPVCTTTPAMGAIRHLSELSAVLSGNLVDLILRQ